MTKKSDKSRITPVFFPFTYIPASVADRVYQLLGRVIVYQADDRQIPDALRLMSRSGVIEIRVPVSKDSHRLAELQKAFISWGIIHQGQGRIFKERSDTGFYNSEFTAQIRSEILKDRQGPALEEAPLFSARLFLLLSQGYDIKQDEIRQQLTAATHDHLTLFSRLKGEPAKARHGMDHFSIDDTGEYMTDSRIYAWMRLMQADKEKSPLLVTDSRSCFNRLFEHVNSDKVVDLIESPSISTGSNPRADLMAFLARLARGPWAGEDYEAEHSIGMQDVDRVFLKLYLLAGVSIDRLVEGSVGGLGVRVPDDSRYPNTLIGLLKT